MLERGAHGERPRDPPETGDPVQKWHKVLRGTNPAMKKKAVVAIGRQLMVDLWRLQTGRVTAQELNLVMIGD